MIKAREINHVALRIGDTERARGFYHQVLGLKTASMPRIDPEQARRFFEGMAASTPAARPTGGVWFEVGNGQLHLISAEKHEGVINPFGPHIAIEVEDFEETKRTLTKRGVKFIEAPAQMVGRQLWVLDPDGNTIELRAEK